ncbi:MAG: hypothetical protein ACETWK_04430 [Candidatus Aminicenantaceae bacterium]
MTDKKKREIYHLPSNFEKLSMDEKGRHIEKAFHSLTGEHPSTWLERRDRRRARRRVWLFRIIIPVVIIILILLLIQIF